MGLGKNVQGKGKAKPNPMTKKHAPGLGNHKRRFTSGNAAIAQAPVPKHGVKHTGQI